MKAVKLNVNVIKAVKDALEVAETFIETVNPTLGGYGNVPALRISEVEQISSMKRMMQGLLAEAQKASAP